MTNDKHDPAGDQWEAERVAELGRWDEYTRRLHERFNPGTPALFERLTN